MKTSKLRGPSHQRQRASGNEQRGRRGQKRAAKQDGDALSGWTGGEDGYRSDDRQEYRNAWLSLSALEGWGGPDRARPNKRYRSIAVVEEFRGMDIWSGAPSALAIKPNNMSAPIIQGHGLGFLVIL